ncbi:LytR C-terminal domain-containing protein [Patescibacteria group bacterium]|nr:LytR C-terminal domain-containing protein [Patescibacteria group bacterium]
MIALNIEDNSIKLLDIRKALFGKLTLLSFTKNDFKKTEQWEEKAPVIKQEVAISIPDSAVHLLRISLPAETPKENIPSFLMEQVREKLDIPIDKMIFDSAIVERTDSEINAIFVGVEFDKLARFYRAWRRIDLSPVVLTTQALSYFEGLKLSLEENQTGLSVNAEDDCLYLLFYDKYGPIKSKTQTVEFDKMPSKIKDAILEFEKERGHRVNKVILGGDQGEDIVFSEIGQDVDCVKAREVVEDLIIKNNLKLKDDYTAKGSFLDTIGLGLIFFDNNKFNLIKNNFEQIMQSIIIEEKPEEVSKDEDDKEKQEVKEDLKKSKVEKKAEETGEVDEDEKKKEEDQQEDSKAIALPENRKRNILLVPSIIFLITVAIAFAGLYFYTNGAYKQLFSTASVRNVFQKPTPIPTAIPSPTPKPIAREDLKSQVLNGSGKEGAASVIAKQLTAKGYKDVKTDNADNYDYKGITIKVKDEYKTFVEKDLKDLSAEVKNLESSSSFDIIVIAGK